MIFRRLVCVVAVAVPTALLAACGSDSNDSVGRAAANDFELRRVAGPVAEYSPVDLRLDSGVVVVRTLKSDRSNVWVIDRITLEVKQLGGGTRFSNVFVGDGSRWGIEVRRDDSAVTVTEFDSPKSEVMFRSADCNVRSGWVIERVLWLRCGNQLHAFASGRRLAEATVEVGERTLILRAADTLWELQQDRFVAVAGRLVGNAVVTGTAGAGPWDTDGNEAWAIDADDSGAPLLRRIDFQSDEAESFRVDTKGLTPYEIAVVGDEVWVTVIERPTILRYRRRNAAQLFGEVELPASGDVDDFDLRIRGDDQGAWIIVRLNADYTLYRAGS